MAGIAVRSPVPGEAGQRERRESPTDMRLDGDEMAADADDGDAGHFSGTYMVRGGRNGRARPYPRGVARA